MIKQTYILLNNILIYCFNTIYLRDLYKTRIPQTTSLVSAKNCYNFMHVVDLCQYNFKHLYKNIRLIDHRKLHTSYHIFKFLLK